MAHGSSEGRFDLISCAGAAQGVLDALKRADTTEELTGLMEIICLELGFRHFALIHHADLRDDPLRRVKILKYPAAVEDRIIGRGAWRRDPVIRACNFSPHAFRWSELSQIVEMDRHDFHCLELGASAGPMHVQPFPRIESMLVMLLASSQVHDLFAKSTV